MYIEKCLLFSNIDGEVREQLLSELSITTKKYKKGESVSFEGDNCDHLSIIMDGEVELQNILPSGRIFTLASLSKGDIFGEAILFSSKHQYPISITATKNVELANISKEEILKGFSINNKLMENYLSLLSNKLTMLNRRAKFLSLDSIRQKIATFLMNNYKMQNSTYVEIKMSRKSMAELMGIQRPSLSRELINMKNEGIVDFDKDMFKIIDLDKLEDCLLK